MWKHKEANAVTHTERRVHSPNMPTDPQIFVLLSTRHIHNVISSLPK